MTPEIDPKPKILLIGQCRYDIASGSLTDADGTPIRLRRQSSDVLAVLAANFGKVVPRDDLIAKVWKGVATTDDSLVQCIADIRRALGKGAVETYPKVGYRLKAAPGPQAGSPANRTLRVAALEPGFAIDGFLAMTPYASESRRARLADALGALAAE